MKKVNQNVVTKSLYIFIMLLLVGCNKPDINNASQLTPFGGQNLIENSIIDHEDEINQITPSAQIKDSVAETIEDNHTQSQQENSTDDNNALSPEEYPTVAAGDAYLNELNENVLFSFHVLNSDKSATICLSENKQDYIIYRYGSKENIELSFPESTDHSWDSFTYSYYMRGGGTENEALDLNYLEFENGGYQYKIYEEYSQEDTLIGIIVTNNSTGQETNIKGDSATLYGSLRPLRDNGKINIIIQ